MRASAFFAVLSFVGILYFRMGVLVLGMSGSDSAHSVAVYSLAGRVPEGLSFFPVAIVNALVPFLSRKSDDREAIASTFNSLVKMIGLSSLAAASVLVLCAHEVILVVGKHEYLPYIRVFQLYAFAVITSFLQYVLANQLICMNREKQVARRYTICLALNVVLCLILGLKFGAIGAITALLICEAVGLTLDGMLLKKLGQSIRLRSLISWGAMLICVGVAYGISLYFDRFYRLPIITITAGLVLIFTAFREIRELARNVQTADTRQVIE
jgi:O-antigen/teichoic acid export membrane protein